MSDQKQFVLVVRLGRCHRSTETDGNRVLRSISLRGCPIIDNSLKGEGQPARGDEIELSVVEGEQGQEVIGSFATLGFVQLTLQPAAFAELWAASAAADGAARDIAIQFISTEPPFYLITKASLFEHMPAAIDSIRGLSARLYSRPCASGRRGIARHTPRGGRELARTSHRSCFGRRVLFWWQSLY